MPTVLRWGAYRAYFYSNEGEEPPHVHVRAGDKEAKFWLDDLSVAINIKLRAHELRAIIRKLREHREELLAAGNDHFGN